MSMSNSFGSGSSTSSSTSFVPDLPEEGILDQLANISSQMGQQQYQWAQGQFAKNSQVTGQTVSNFLDASNLAKSLAQNNLDRYTGEFQPVEDQLVHDANTYSSDARVRQEMGSAESGVGQSFDANRQNAERQLQSFGIDPSSGRYQELEQADASKRAAAQAGAAQAARYNTESTGRQLRQQAIGVGQQYPAQIANTLNSEANALSGAENSILGNANTGANMFNSANGFMKTAMDLKYPPLGQRSNSQSNNSSTSSNNGGGGGRSNGSNGRGNDPTGGGSGRGNGVDQPVSQQGQQGYQAHPITTHNGSAMPHIQDVNGGLDTGQGNQWSGTDPLDQTGYNYMGQPDPWSQQDGQDPTMGWGTDGTQVGGTDGMGNWNGTDRWGGSDPTQNSGFGFSDTSSNTDQFGNGNTYDGGQAFGDNGGQGYTDTGGYDYDAGGAVPDDSPSTGGYVPDSLSPSGGASTDDIPARLNANEFVVPRDVAMWKGQEFFQKLIEQSRKALQGASAKGQPAPAPQGAPRFVSRGA